MKKAYQKPTLAKAGTLPRATAAAYGYCSFYEVCAVPLAEVVE